MTVSTSINQVVHTTNGTTTAFPFSFKVLKAGHLVVQRRVVSTGLIDKTYAESEYSVSGIGSNSGTVTITPALASGYEIIISRIVPYTQLVDIVNQGGFYPDVIEEQLDFSAMGLQQLSSRVNRTLAIPPGGVVEELPPATNRAGKFLAFDAAGAPSMSSGTGADSGLRTDLTVNGASLVGFGSGVTLTSFLATGDGTLHVATTGNDTTGNGTLATPFATPQKAVDAAALVTGRNSITIEIAAGIYATSSRAAASMDRPAVIYIDGIKSGKRTAQNGATLSGGLVIKMAAGAKITPNATYPRGIYVTGHVGSVGIVGGEIEAAAGASEALLTSHRGVYLHVRDTVIDGNGIAPIGLFCEAGGLMECIDVTATGSTADISCEKVSFLQMAAPAGAATVGSISNVGNVDLAVGMSCTGTITNRSRLTFTGTAAAPILLSGNYDGAGGTVYGAYVRMTNAAASIVSKAELWKVDALHSNAQLNFRGGVADLSAFQSFVAPATQSTHVQPIRLLDGARLAQTNTINNLNSAGILVGPDLVPTGLAISANAQTILPELYGEDVHTLRLTNTKGSAVTGTILGTTMSNWMAGTRVPNGQILQITCEDTLGIELVASTTIDGLPTGAVTLGLGAGKFPAITLRYLTSTNKWSCVDLAPIQPLATVADPTGGTTIDAENRAVTNTLIDRLQAAKVLL